MRLAGVVCGIVGGVVSVFVADALGGAPMGLGTSLITVPGAAQIGDTLGGGIAGMLVGFFIALRVTATQN